LPVNVRTRNQQLRIAQQSAVIAAQAWDDETER